MQQQTTVIPNSGAHTQNMYNPSGVQVITTSAPGPGGVPQPAQPQQQVVYVQAAPAFRPLATGPTLYKNYPGKASQILGGLQVAVGILLIIFNIAAIVIHAHAANGGTGIWTGIFFIITGSFGIPAGRRKESCPIVTFMVMSIISAVFAVPVLIASAVGASCEADTYGCGYDYYWNYRNYGERDARIGLNATMAFLGGFEMILAIVSSGLCCAGMCCRGGSTRGDVLPGAQATLQISTQQPTVAYQQPGYYPAQGQPQQAMPPPQPQASGYHQATAPPTYSGDAPPAYAEQTGQQIQPKY